MHFCLRRFKLDLKWYRNIAGLTDVSYAMETTEGTTQVAKGESRGDTSKKYKHPKV